MNVGDTVVIIEGEYRGYFAAFVDTVGLISNVELLYHDKPAILEYILASVPTNHFRATPSSVTCDIKMDPYFMHAKQELNLNAHILTLCQKLVTDGYFLNPWDAEFVPQYYHQVIWDMWEHVFSNTTIDDNHLIDLPGILLEDDYGDVDDELNSLMRRIGYGLVVTNQVSSEADIDHLANYFEEVMCTAIETDRKKRMWY